MALFLAFGELEKWKMPPPPPPWGLVRGFLPVSLGKLYSDNERSGEKTFSFISGQPLQLLVFGGFSALWVLEASRGGEGLCPLLILSATRSGTRDLVSVNQT